MRRYRKGVGFVMDELAHYSRIDRNAKARLLHACEVLERSTKAPGRRNGALGLHTLAVLRCLLLRFHNAGNGRCCPSYQSMQEATGFCRQTIARAISRLEAVGVLVVTRRLVRELCHSSGRLVVRQGCNLYAFRNSFRKVWPKHLKVWPKLRQNSARTFPKSPRVYGVGANHGKIIKTDETRADIAGVFRERVPVDACWRTKARAMFTKS